MSKSNDILETVKLDPENSKAIRTVQAKFTKRPSRSFMANLAIKLGLSKIKPS